MRFFFHILKATMLGLVVITLVTDGSLALASAQPTVSGPTPLVVIVSARSGIHDLPKALLKRIFLGEASEYQGTRFVPLNYVVSDPVRRAFDEMLLGFAGDAAGRYWVDRRIRGQGLPPRIAPSSAVVRVAVAKLPGAIGYVRPADLDASVRAVTVDGLPYTAADYALRASR
ncbi:MAG: hypothetical protein QM778_18005 [Myxococcales bacterium]